MKTTPSEPISLVPLALLAGAFSAGIVSTVAMSVPVILCSLGTAACVVAAVFLQKQKGVATGFITFAFFFSGAALATLEKQPIASNRLKRLLDENSIHAGEPVEISGALPGDLEIAPGRRYLDVQVQTVRVRGIEREASGEVSLFLPVPNQSIANEIGQLDLRLGARIRVMTVLERADNFRNPGVSSFTEYLDRRGYDATGVVKSPLLIERLEDERVLLPLSWLYEWRKWLQLEIYSRFSSDAAGVLIAALLGNRHYLSHATAERFREGGTFHVLVISGLHITFIGGVVLMVVRRFTKSAMFQFLLPVAVLWAYTIAVGAEPAVLRAALMFSVVLGATLVSRRASSVNALGGVAITLLVWQPGDLFDPSFQLTFVSVLAILAFAFPVLQRLSAIGSWRPTRETPYPPSCATWLRSLCEIIYWSERSGKRELQRTNYSYRLFKAPLAMKLDKVHLQRPLQYVFAALVVSAGVQLALLPFLIVYFHRLSLASFLLNIIVSILLAAVAFVAVLGLVISQLTSTLAAPLIAAADTLNWVMIHSVDPFSKAGLASLRVPEYSRRASVVYLIYYIPLAVLVTTLWRWRPMQLPMQLKTASTFKHMLSPARQMKAALIVQSIACAVVILHPFSEAKPNNRLEVDFLDVGQGDSALLTLPDGTTMLFDGGGRPGPFAREIEANNEDSEFIDRDTRSIGEAVVSEYLWWRGLDTVDYLVATHADADHIDGLNDVLRNFAVRAVLVARVPTADLEYSRLFRTASSRRTPIRLIGAGDEIRVGEVTMNILSPVASASSLSSSANDDSVVARLSFGQRTFLLTGDIEAKAEHNIVGTSKDLASDVIKVAHHGSKSSSTDDFAQATRPTLAIISVGQQSIFGHPHPEVVERWQRLGAKVLTTGRSGTITVSTDGSDLTLETFTKER